MTRRGRSGSALLEFAIAWPVALLLVVGTVQLAIWGTEVYAVRQAALAGARAGSGVGGGTAVGLAASLEVLRPSLVGVSPAAWCPGQPRPPRLWVCVRESASLTQVTIRGTVPGLLPLLPGGLWLPVGADVALPRETFQ